MILKTQIQCWFSAVDIGYSCILAVKVQKHTHFLHSEILYNCFISKGGYNIVKSEIAVKNLKFILIKNNIDSVVIVNFM